jgi:hypothetical protein
MEGATAGSAFANGKAQTRLRPPRGGTMVYLARRPKLPAPDPNAAPWAHMSQVLDWL